LAKKQKYYVVWEGHKRGIFKTWAECQQQTRGYAQARFKSFKTLAEAKKALLDPMSVTSIKKTKYYVVWQGNTPGIYTDWDEARKSIKGATKPKYKTFGSKELAQKAFTEGPENYEGRSFKTSKSLTKEQLERIGQPIDMSLSVDAACNGRTGVFEYQGVITDSRTRVFHGGPWKNGTNNVGEFLALVHGLAYLKKNRSDLPIYSDSRTAMAWVKRGKANSTAKDPKTIELLMRAEKWLAENSWNNPIMKWETKAWGDIPADFNRK
jgi:ribonuclease HI